MSSDIKWSLETCWSRVMKKMAHKAKKFSGRRWIRILCPQIVDAWIANGHSILSALVGIKLTCSCHFSQVLGIDFSKNNSPAMNEITFQVLLLAMIHFRLLVKIVNIKITFVNGDIKEGMYTECPKVWTKLEKTSASF